MLALGPILLNAELFHGVVLSIEASLSRDASEDLKPGCFLCSSTRRHEVVR